MSLRRYHGESANVHSSSNIHLQKEITENWETIAVADVGEYNRMTWAIFNLGSDNAIECQLFGNLLKVPDTTDFSQENGWFVISSITWAGFYSSSSYNHMRVFSTSVEKASVYHNFLFGIQYVALTARCPGTGNTSTILATGHAAG